MKSLKTFEPRVREWTYKNKLSSNEFREHDKHFLHSGERWNFNMTLQSSIDDLGFDGERLLDEKWKKLHLSAQFKMWQLDVTIVTLKCDNRCVIDSPQSMR